MRYLALLLLIPISLALTIGIYPATVSLEVNPGESKAMFFKAVYDTPVSGKPASSTPWITFPGEILKNGEFSAILAAPKDAEPGSYEFTVWVEPAYSGTVKSSGSKVTVKVLGTKRHEIIITDIGAEKRGKLEFFYAKLLNNGTVTTNVSVKATGAIDSFKTTTIPPATEVTVPIYLGNPKGKVDIVVIVEWDGGKSYKEAVFDIPELIPISENINLWIGVISIVLLFLIAKFR